MSSWAPTPNVTLGLPCPQSRPFKFVFCAPREALWKYQNLLQGPQTLARGQDAPSPRTVHLFPLSSIPKAVFSSVVPSLHSKTASRSPRSSRLQQFVGGGCSCLLAQNEWKPLKRQAGPNWACRTPGSCASVFPALLLPAYPRDFCLLPQVEGVPLGEGFGRSWLPGRGGASPCPRLRAEPDGKGRVSRDPPPRVRRHAGTEPSLPFPTRLSSGSPRTQPCPGGCA